MYLFALAFLIYCVMVSSLDHVWKAGLVGAVATVWFFIHAWPGILLSLGVSIYLIVKDDIPPFNRWI